MLDKKVFKEGIKKLAIAFNIEFKKEQLDLWYKYCNNLKDLDFNKKVNNCILTCRHKPYIADLLDIKENVYFKPANAGAYKVIEVK